MRAYTAGLPACLLVFSACLSAADVKSEVKGKVTDPSGAPVPRAQVSVVSRVGVEAQTLTAPDGAFQLAVSQDPATRLVVTAPGFQTQSLAPAAEIAVRLELAPVVDSVRVVGTAIDTPASEQGGTVGLISSQELRERNETYAADLLRELPGMSLNQSGPPGSVMSLFQRGGYSDYTLVEIDGVPVNSFGGAFDFAHIPAEAIDHIEVASGPQSALYGPYANSGAINFVTRQPEAAPQLDILAEGGTYQEHRFGITGTGAVAGLGLAISASRVDDNGPVINSDYHNEDILLHAARRFTGQSLSFGGYFDANSVGEPGPWGSDPEHDFTGIDTISRSKNDFTDAWAHYEMDLSPIVREEVTGSFFLNNNGYASPYGWSFNKDLRWQGDARTILSATRHYVAAVGVSFAREEVKNTYITDAGNSTFPIPRDDIALYLENRLEFGGRLFITAGVRGEFIETAAIPTDGYSRPFFPANTITSANPKVAAGYALRPSTRLHSSAGTGIRPPAGFDLAFTNNPHLLPERTRSVDAGVDQKLAGGLVLLDATWFYNRYYDLIVTLGGSLTALSQYQTANLANSKAQGGEFSAAVRPARWIFVRGSYTLLSTSILSLNGVPNQAPLPFTVGQELLRRPANSGSLVAGFTRGRVTAGVTGIFRGRTLDVDPSYGADAGLFWDGGYANLGIHMNVALAHGVTAYGNLHNALNDHYEEAFGYPSPRLNFVAGLKWHLPAKETR
ncbi:MAG: TonB-dependent receptor domain-containing protein [Bryobacteraceae bacterium]